MTRITNLCVLGLLLLGMLCVPVTAETKDQGHWSFYVVDAIAAASDVDIDGHGHIGSYGIVNVSDVFDQVKVKFRVVAGPGTSLTITRDYINNLRKEHPGQEPVLYAWGAIDTYDVDAGGLYFDTANATNNAGPPDSTVTTYEHLKKRGLIHSGIGETFKNKFSGSAPCVRYVRDESQVQDYWSFYIVNDILGAGYVKIDGQRELAVNLVHSSFGKVDVSNTVDQVEMKFGVTAGPGTPITITKDTINKIRKEYPGQEPVLYTWGAIDTYDVNIGVLSPDYSQVTIYDHLNKRGLIHLDIGKAYDVYLKDTPDPDVIFIMS